MVEETAIKEFIFKLGEGVELEYSRGGAMQKAQFITLFPPKYEHIDKTAPIKQAFFRAASALNQSENTGSSEKEEQQVITGDEVMMLLYQSESDILPTLLHGEKLLTSGVALVEGETKLTIPLFRALSTDVSERMLGDYIANFIIASVLKNQKTK